MARDPASLHGGVGRLDRQRSGEIRSRPPRLIVALQHPVQHFSPGFRALADRAHVELNVLYWKDLRIGQHDPGFGRHITWDVDLLDGYNYWRPDAKTAVGRALESWRWLRASRPDCVLSFGWASPAARGALSFSLATRVPYLLYGDNSWQHRPRSVATVLRDAAIRAVCRRSAGAITTGTFNREDLIRLGIHPSHAFPGVYPIDDYYFQPTTEVTPHSTFTIGFAGKFIPRKGVDELLRAVASMPPDLAWQCILVGDGPLRADLEQLAQRSGIADRVKFVGFTNQSQMPGLLREMDLLVVPSYVDMRVLIATEAMAGGTPVVVSSGTAVWGEGDQIRHGETGWVYPSGDPDALAALLTELANAPELRRDVARKALEESSRFGPTAFAEHVEHAVATVVSSTNTD